MSVDMNKINMEQWWNDPDGIKPKDSGKNVCPNATNTTCANLGTKPGLRGEKPELRHDQIQATKRWYEIVYVYFNS